MGAAASKAPPQGSEQQHKQHHHPNAPPQHAAAAPQQPRGSRVWAVAVSHPWRPVRVAAMAAVYGAMAARCAALYKREAALAAAAQLALCAAAGPARGAALGLTSAAAALTALAAREPEVNLGHRLGAEGYPPPPAPCENTISALAALLAADRAALAATKAGKHGGGRGGAGLPGLHYVEFDVRECGDDGELIVLHDGDLMERSFPPTGANIPILESLGLLEPATSDGDGANGVRRRRRGVPPGAPAASVRAAPLAALRRLRLGGEGSAAPAAASDAAAAARRAPTLQEVLAAARALGCAAPVVIEVKSISTDRGREALVKAVEEHAAYAKQVAAAHPERAHPGYGFLAVIAFPHLYAASFGEFCSPDNAQWTRRLTAAGARVRAPVFWQLDFARGL